MVRRLASKRQRRALWRAAGGFCALCGRDLTHAFHADHVTPFAAHAATNAHDMRALCPDCNWKKGAGMFRSHQKQAVAISAKPELGNEVKKVLAAVTPGGGKSALPVIFAHRMIDRGLADKVCWVVPRDSLRTQAELAFMDKRFRGLLGHSLEIRAAGNDINPSRGAAGYATTYQAVSVDPDLHADEFRRSRYVLVLDEVHHVEDGGVWHRALQRMVDQSALVVLLSGTLSRADGKRIAFVDYELDQSGRAQPVVTNTATTACIRYTRQTALEERAILPIYFERVDGQAQWVDGYGEERAVTSLAGAGDDTGGALYTALRQEYAFDLLFEMVEHWRHYRDVHPRSKFLVVAPNISLAKAYLKRCRDLGLFDVDIATSEDSDEAKANIERLKGRKKPELRGLVTVGMAYEGLDCPAITHIACLTHIRSHEWIEQMLARATRVDYAAGDYDEQAAHVWAPDDDLFSEAVARIQAEQAPFLEEREEGEEDRRERTQVEREVDPIIPLGANSTTVRAVDMQDGNVIDGAEYRRMREALAEAGMRHVLVSQFKKAMDAFNKVDVEEVEKSLRDDHPEMTMAQREYELRRQIDKRIKQVARGDGETIKAINTAVIRALQKTRDEATADELKRAFAVVEEWAARRNGGGNASV